VVLAAYLLTLAPWLAICTGCGGSSGVAHVQGKVTIGGKDLPADASAFISFARAEAKPGDKPASAPIEGGQYNCANAPTGKVKVRFEITKPTGPMKKSERTGEDYQEMITIVPAAKMGGIDATIDGDKSDLNFDL